MASLAVKPRTDEDLRREVQDELAWDLRVGTLPIGVNVKQGVVTLTGEVDSFAKKVAAAEAAHHIRGVTAVANDLSVHLPATAERTDTEIARAVVDTLTWHALIPAHQIAVTVAAGIVTLKGTVEYDFQRQNAATWVTYLTGVRAVVNQLVILLPVKRDVVKQHIEAALVRNAEVEADNITVEVHGTTVTLKGHVRTFAERLTAEASAWLAPGVMAIDNRLVIQG